MIVGRGQIAQAFLKNGHENVLIFASGVPNSNCTDEGQFDRERELLLSTLQLYGNKKFVYFSSCALSAPEYPKNAYYRHKAQMEELIKSHSNHYYIFRIPQLFGKLKEHNTIINFFYNKIMHGETFTVYNRAYRYVIEIGDVVQLVNHYLAVSPPNLIVDLANPYRYSVIEIIHILERLTNKIALYNVVEKADAYELELSDFEAFVQAEALCIPFSKNYLEDRLKSQFITL